MSTELKLIKKEELISSFKEFESRGWIENTTRKTNDGAHGNLLEDLLNIPENNLPIPNAAEWELKCHKVGSSSRVTLFHTEPSPRAAKIVPQFLLPKYGWLHQKAGTEYPEDEKSFRVTLKANSYQRGFYLYINEEDNKVCIGFDSSKVLDSDASWLKTVKQRVGHLNNLDVVPYWNLDEIYAKTRTKLLNCFFVLAEEKRENQKQYFHYFKAYMLKNFSIKKFKDSLEEGYIVFEFDARSGHNHGTKCRITEELVPSLYEESKIVLDKPRLRNN